MNRKLSRGVCGALAFIGILSCSDHSITGTNSDELRLDAAQARIATIAVNFSSTAIAVGDTTRAMATLRDNSSRPLSRAVIWATSNPSIATVDSLGLVTGVGEGSAIISATSGGITGSGSIIVGTAGTAAGTTTPGTVSDLSVVSTDSTSVTLTFTQVDDGTGQPAKYDVRWAVAPISWGDAASTSNGSCTTPVSGTAIGSPLNCTVAGLKVGTKYDFQLVAFRGTLNQSGVAFGGLSNIVAATTAVSAPVPVATVTVSPSSASVQVGSTVQLSATTKDSNGNVLTGRTISWSSSNTSIATVSAAGVVSGVAAGSAQVSATSEGKSGSATITVGTGKPGTVTDLSVSAIDSTGVALSFTQVDDGTGQPAKYDIRYAVAPISWGDASSVTSGTCKTPIAGTGIGSVLTCMVLGLKPATKYNFQLVAFRGVLNQTGIAFGSLSNVAAATTTSGGPPPPPTNPGAVRDLAVSAIDSNAVTLSFTQVDDGTGQPAKYDVRYSLSPISWGSATSVANGTCATPLAGTAVGSRLTCRVLGLSPSTRYDFQLISFRGTLNQSGVVFGPLSNVASATTNAGGSPPPPPPPTGSPEPGSGDVVLWQDNFNKATLAEQLAPYSQRGDHQLITDGHSGNAMRFPYTASSSDNLIELSFPATTDIYFRYWYRLSVGADPTCGNRNESGFKWFMPWRSTDPRYTMGVTNLTGGPPGFENTGLEFASHDNSSTQMPNPFMQNINKSKTFRTTADGAWHEYTLHIVTGNGGYEQIWVDGLLLLDDSAYHYDHSSQGISLVQFPGTMVQWYSGCEFYVDVDDFVIWHR